MDPYRPDVGPRPRREPISSAGSATPPVPPRRPAPTTASIPTGSHPVGPAPQPRRETRLRPRRRTRWVLAAVAAILAIGAGTFVAQGVSTTAAARPAAPATPVRKQDLSAAAIANQNDAAIVDVISTLSYQNGQAAGTGIVLTSSGEILTNNHVIQGSTSITVKISNGSRTFPATVVGADLTNDIAVVQAQGASGLTTAPVGNSSAVTVGQSVVAIGNALNKPGLPTVTEGTVTGLGRAISVTGDSGNVEQLQNLVETSASLQPGNSGGPLFDTAGHVIGINTAASSGNIPNGGTTDGYAIPINDALAVAHQIESGHSTTTVHIGASPFLGVQVRTARGLGNGPSGGSRVLVAGVEPGTPAESAGIAAGDQITAIGGTTVSSQSELTAALTAKHPGDTITVMWVDQSNGQHSATVRLATGPAI